MACQKIERHQISLLPCVPAALEHGVVISGYENTHQNNSLRYRLTRSEIAGLAKVGYLEDKVKFSGQTLMYALKIIDGGCQLLSSFKNNTITLFIPKSMISELEGTDKVGFGNNDRQLHLLVEKDFTCLENVTEVQSDNYPNQLVEKI